MSLVGPRPKLPEHVVSNPSCRPGITGAATIVFAREELILDQVPKHLLESCYHTVVLPAKRRLDAEYMACATFRSDLKLIVESVLRRWDTSVMEGLLNGAFEAEDRKLFAREFNPEAVSASLPMPPNVERPVSVEQLSAL
jgi:hypothetical protein